MESAIATEPEPLSGIEQLLNRVYRRQEPLLAIAGIMVIVLVAALDYRTGYQIGFSSLYLIPIFVATLYVRRQAGTVIALTAAFVWVLTDLLTSRASLGPELEDWNTVIRVGFFALIAFSLIALRRDLVAEQRLSRLDTLTGIGNVRAFNEFLAKRHDRPLTIAYLDCDNFKGVNDTRGHAAGDQLLQLVARLLVAGTRSGDLVARIGGDEFVLVLTETDPLKVEAGVDRLHRQLTDEVRAAGFPVTFSVGVVTYTEPRVAAHHMIKEADALMYTVKQGKKNDVAYRTDRRKK